MYKFTNGLVVFDEKTRDEYIKMGYRLVEVKKEVVNEENKIGNEFVNKFNQPSKKRTGKNIKRI